VLDRSGKGKELRQALWTTHEEVNKAVAKIEEILLLCRGRSYVTRDGDVTADTVQQKAFVMAREAQKKNGKVESGSNEDVLSALQRLYEELVPSVLLDKKGEPVKGDSQSVGNSYARPLMKLGSQDGPFSEVAQKLPNPLPEWARQEPVDGDEARKWAKSEAGKAFIESMAHLSGAKNRWLKEYQRDIRSDWPTLLAEFWRELKDDFRMTARETLWQKLGLLPLMPPPFKDFTWNGLAIRIAVGHLLSWESWNHRCAKEHAKLSALVAEKEDAIGKIEACVVEKIRGYEKKRHEELLKHSLAKEEMEFRINTRMVRAYDRVTEKWERCNSEKQRKEALAVLQAELRGKYGDPDLYLWLAKDENVDVWRQEDEKPLIDVAQLNALKRLLDKRKPQAVFTLPDAVKHPRWAQFEGPGGSNLKNYGIQNANEAQVLSLPLLCQTAEGLMEKDFTIRLASSGQIKDAEVLKEDSRRMTFFYGDEQYAASMGGSDILFDRTFLEYRKPEDIRDGRIGPVWFKLVLDIDSKAPDGWLANGRPKTPEAIHHFKSALGNDKHKDAIEAGLRVLTVDLGIRAFTSGSVFELVKGKPEKGLCWLADEAKDLWAKHERSFVLAMPGDKVSAREEESRRDAEGELGGFEQGRMLLRGLLRVAIAEDVQERREKFETLCSGKERYTGRDLKYQISKEEKGHLEEYLGKQLEVWKAQVMTVFKGHEKKLSDNISAWREKTAPKRREREYAMGKSYWGIKYFEDVRDLLKGWSTHAREYGQITRWDRDKLGTFANRLLEHINNKKEDRTKTGADLIIQSARGMVYNDKTGEWEKKFEPCRLILFEDLAMYRFRTDRPRRENSQLMRWSHRAILDEVKQQASIYGIHIETTGAEFSSKFYAKNGCPGRRVTKLDANLIAYIQADEARVKRLADDGFGDDWLKEGNIVPWDGGEFFAGLSSRDKLEIIHADINAAQNLQRRFWTRFADAFRVPVKEIGENTWMSQNEGKRLVGGLSKLVGTDGPVKFISSDNEFAVEKVTGRKPKSTVEDEEGGLDEMADELMDLGVDVNSEEGKGKAVLFRDASGLILRSDRFYESKEFWGRVNKRINKALREKYERGKT
jgi:hypothetical protein